MKAIQTLSLFFLYALVTNSCRVDPLGRQPEVDNLFLIYVAAANDLEPYALYDPAEIEAGMTDVENGIALVLVDRLANAGDGFDDWDEVKLYEYSHDDSGVVRCELEAPEMGLYLDYIDDELNTGDGQTLRSFLDFAANRYIYQTVHLCVWNHGGDGDLQRQGRLPLMKKPKMLSEWRNFGMLCRIH